MKELEQVLADARSDARALARNGDERVAAIIERLAREVEESAEPWLRWLGENDAMLFDGHSRDWHRKQFPRWCREGKARVSPTNTRERQYRMAILPHRSDMDAIRADAIGEARKAG